MRKTRRVPKTVIQIANRSLMPVLPHARTTDLALQLARASSMRVGLIAIGFADLPKTGIN
jgi:hypothetical protein